MTKFFINLLKSTIRVVYRPFGVLHIIFDCFCILFRATSRYPKYSDTYIVKNLEIVYFEPMISHIDVNLKYFIVSINFRGRVTEGTNFGLDFDVDDYSQCAGAYICKRFCNENDFINELHRLNYTGLNIKG